MTITPFIVGELSASASIRPVIHVERSEETAHLRSGDLVEAWGYLAEWDDDCVTQEMSESRRKEGDPLCDAAVDLLWPNLSTSAGIDLLAALESHVAEHRVEDAAHAFLKAVSRHPPEDICVAESDIHTACEFFLDHALQISQAFMYFSLVGGFASPRIVTTLHAVSYLVSHNSDAGPEAISQAQLDRTYTRLMETYQFVLDVLGCTSSTRLWARPSQSAGYLMPGGEGWKSAVRVRMLHAVARRRARGKLEKAPGIIDYVPINQEDMSATLASFSVVPLVCLDRLRLSAKPTHARAYLALWRHVGFYLGVSPPILRRHFAAPGPATKFLASTVIHLFSPPPPGFKALPPPTLPILHAVSTRGVMRTSFAYSCAAARLFLGDPLAAHVGVPPAAGAARVRLRCALHVQRLGVLFARHYPRRAWAEKRRTVFREGLVITVQSILGMRRTAFRPRGGDGKELGKDVMDQEKVEGNPRGGRALKRLAWELWAELLGVLLLLMILATLLLWYGVVWFEMAFIR
ncbi:hypothetical protein BV25DRAFT_1885002 [Artomyces pyxidatus]|uniref:Uncharacterized protein n=1 Tax=Artomyces pyxidatus TaxID=48021 RepID=A0ACB8T490_9AGAM|nr:hypothetical protein BV25DRAFT_1885002 [Artomyces pyxidatus]